MRAALTQSAPATTPMMVTGTITARKSCGRYRGEVAVECIDAGRHQHAEIPGVATLEAGGPERGDLVRSGAPQLGLGGG